MLALSLDAADETIIQGLNTWLDLLIRHEYQKAFDLTYHPEGDHWTPELLREQIRFYGDQLNAVLQMPSGHASPKPEHFVQRPNPDAAPPLTLSTGRRIGSYESLVAAENRVNPTFLGEVSFQLPFGGTWSDVFATFLMINHRERLVLFLKSIYVH